MKTKKNYFLLVLLVLISVNFGYSQAGRAPGRGSLRYRNFYRPNFPNTNRNINLNQNNQSRQLTDAMADLSTDGGGTLTVTGPNNITLRNVELSSNVHLRFRSNITLRFPNGNSGLTMIKGGDAEGLTNVAITCVGNDDDDDNWFKVDLVNGLAANRRRRTNRSFLNLSDVKGFMIAGFEIIDDHTTLNAITLNVPDERRRAPNDDTPNNDDDKSNTNDVRNFGPEDGIIRNIELTGKANKGNGMIQIQAAKNVIFSRLSGRGGAIVRFESGSAEVNLDRPGGPKGQVRTINNVYVRDITVTDGGEALLLSPHRISQGKVDADRINAIRSIVAVKIQAGFTDGNTGGGDIDPINPEGSFASNSRITDVNVTGGFGAPYTNVEARYLTCSQKNTQGILDRRNSQRYRDRTNPGRAIGGVLYLSNESLGCGGNTRNCYTINMSAGQVSLSGNLIFSNNGRRLFGLDNEQSNNNFGGSCNAALANDIEDFTLESNAAAIYPNPTSSNVYLKEASSWSLYSISGQLVKQGEGKEIDLSSQAGGVYFVKVNGETHKVVKL